MISQKALVPAVTSRAVCRGALIASLEQCFTRSCAGGLLSLGVRGLRVCCFRVLQALWSCLSHSKYLQPLPCLIPALLRV